MSSHSKPLRWKGKSTWVHQQLTGEKVFWVPMRQKRLRQWEGLSLNAQAERRPMGQALLTSGPNRSGRWPTTCESRKKIPPTATAKYGRLRRVPRLRNASDDSRKSAHAQPKTRQQVASRAGALQQMPSPRGGAAPAGGRPISSRESTGGSQESQRSS